MSITKAAFRPKWPYGLPKRSAAAPKPGPAIQLDYDLAKVRNRGNVTVRRVARVE